MNFVPLLCSQKMTGSKQVYERISVTCLVEFVVQSTAQHQLIRLYVLVQTCSGYWVTGQITFWCVSVLLCMELFQHITQAVSGGTNLSSIWQAPSACHTPSIAYVWHFRQCECDSMSLGPPQPWNECVSLCTLPSSTWQHIRGGVYKLCLHLERMCNWNILRTP